ncbi:UNVERIFIED_CONTAM: hypothetical protein LK11_46110 [Mumia flava]
MAKTMMRTTRSLPYDEVLHSSDLGMKDQMSLSGRVPVGRGRIPNNVSFRPHSVVATRPARPVQTQTRRLSA